MKNQNKQGAFVKITVKKSGKIDKKNERNFMRGYIFYKLRQHCK